MTNQTLLTINEKRHDDNKPPKKCKLLYCIYTLCVHVFIIINLIVIAARYKYGIVVFVLTLVVLFNMCINMMAFPPDENPYDGMDILDLFRIRFFTVLYNIAVIVTFIVLLCIFFDSYDIYIQIVTIVAIIVKFLDMFFSCCSCCA
jgi:hypothetical protein